MSTQGTIKQNIKYVLDTLKRKETLRDVQVDDFKKNLFTRDFPAFPAAVLTTASTESRSDTNRSNLRTYTYDVVIICNKSDVTGSEYLEDLAENILNEFDNDPMLKGGTETAAADGGVLPSSSTPGPVEGTNFIAFVVTLQVKATRDLTYV